MGPVKPILISLGMVMLLILGGCSSSGGNAGGNAGGDTGSISGNSVANSQENNPGTGAITPSTADFFHLAIVPDQTVNTATFEVQVIAENIDPNSPPTPPNVIDAAGNSYAMTLKTLKWPTTTDDSVTIYGKDIPLVPDQLNNIKVVSGAKELAFSIRHKSSLSTLSASNSTELINHVKAAITDPSIDVIEVNYDEPDLGNTIHNIGNGVLSKRTTWLTVRPAATRTVSWVRDSGAALRRPKIDFLHLEQVTFGSDSSDGGGGHYYTERLHHIWLSNTQFRGKYKHTWPKDTKLTANYATDVRVLESEGQKGYFTDCTWDGTASNTATSAVQLGRDLHFSSHRGDVNNFGKVFLNVLAADVSPIRNATDTDYLHNDGFQIWGNSGTTDLVFKGFKVVSPNIGAELQPFLFDRTYTPNYAKVLVDTVIVEGAQTILRAQLAGHMTDSRISNLNFSNQVITIRQDFSEPNGSFTPTNVRIHNLEVKSVAYNSSVAGASKNYDYKAVANTSDISNELNAKAALSGAIFSNIKVSPAP